MPVTATLRRLRQEDCGAGGPVCGEKGEGKRGVGEGNGEGGGRRKSPNPKHLLL